MKNLIILFILLSGWAYSQKRTSFIFEIDLVSPNMKNYFFNDSKNKIFEAEIVDNGFLLKSFGIQSNYNYFVFKKLSIGAVGGFQTLNNPNFLMLRLGGVLRYHFVDKENIYTFLQLANNFTVNDDKFKTANNFRIGLGYPILRKEKFNILMNIFFEQNYFKLDGSSPLMNFEDEIPRSLTVHSAGISFGAKF